MSSIDRLAARILDLERQVKSLSTPQLSRSSIIDGAIEQIKIVDTGEIDESGNPIFREDVVARYGEQPDGSNAAVILAGPTPPTPSEPIVSSGPGFITVEWDGQFVDGSEAPADFAHVAVHVADALAVDEGDIIMPSADSARSTIHTLEGGSVVVGDLDEGSYYVSLVTVSQANEWSEPAPWSTGEPGVMSAVDVEARAIAEAAVEAAEEAKREAAQAWADSQAAKQAALAAEAEAAEARSNATVALEAANGKNVVWYSVADPQPGDGADGDTWFVRSPGHSGEVLRIYEKIEGKWETRQLTDSTVASLTAGKITSGTLGVGQVITVGSPDGAAYLTIGNSTIQAHRRTGDPDDPVMTTMSIGGTDSDSIMLSDPDGNSIVGMTADGEAWAETVVTNQLIVSGFRFGNPGDVDDLLWQYPRGVIAQYLLQQDSPQADSMLGVAEISADLEANRRYRIRFDGNIMAGQADSVYRLVLYYVRGSGGSEAPAPSLNPSNLEQIAMGFFHTGSLNTHMRSSIEALYYHPYSEQTRFVLALQRVSGGYPKFFYDGRGTLTVEDVGAVYPGTPTNDVYYSSGQMTLAGGQPYATGSGANGSTPSGVRQTYTKTYNCSWSQSYDGSNNQMGTSEIRQGPSSYHGQMKAAIGFPARAQSDLAGASISKIELKLYVSHWYYSRGGTATIGLHTSSSVPGSFPSSSMVTSRKWSVKTGALWVTIPSSAYSQWSSGSAKGFTVGVGAGRTNEYYARCHGYGAKYPPQMRVTYLK